MLRGSLLACLGLLALGCAMPRYVKTAYFGNLAELKKDIAEAAKAGRVDRAGVLDLAEAVARREVRSAKGQDALDRIRESRQCLRSVELEVRERAKSYDDAGAAALLALVEADLVAKGPILEQYGHAANGAFRAAAARAAVGKEWSTLRRSFYADPDERVRASALRAALEARDPDDVALLFDAARLDPNSDNGAVAIRALGAVGADGAALALKDLWTSADQGRRFAIVDAWGSARVFDAGGAEELVRLAQSNQSLESVAAAGTLARIGKTGAQEGDAVLVRATAEGTSAERATAVALVGLEAEALSAVDRAAKADDSVVRTTALARLLDVPSRRAQALATLEGLATGSDGAARQAQDVLARIGDGRIARFLERQVGIGVPAHRREVAVGLFQMGHPAAMAAALADPDPSVRMAVACSVLAGRGGSAHGAT